MLCKNITCAIGWLLLLMVTGCGMVTKEVFTINPDLSGKCVIEAKMFVDTTQLDASLALKDSMYGIKPSYPDFHKMQFSHKDAMLFALKIIHMPGIEIWNNIRFGMSKKRDMIYFSGIAYFRDIRKFKLSMLDSVLQVSSGIGGQFTFKLEPKKIPLSVHLGTDDEINKKVDTLRKKAFYIRPVLADRLNPTEATIIYNLPGDIKSSSGMDQQGNHIVQLTLTGNQILKYADSVAKNQQLAVEQYKATNGANNSVLEPQFNSILWGIESPVEVTFDKGSEYLFDYNTEVQNALSFFDNFMEKTKLQKLDSNIMMGEERAEEKRPKEYGELDVNKFDSAAKKPYFVDLMAVQSHDTLLFSGELSKDIKAPEESRIHIIRVVTGTNDDITDSLADKNKITARLMPNAGTAKGIGPKRKVSFILLMNFPPGCKEMTVLGKLVIVDGKHNTYVPFKIKQIAVNAKKGK